MDIINNTLLIAKLAKAIKDTWEFAKPGLKKPWKKFDYMLAAKAYAKAMQDRYGKINILNMTAPIPLKGIFTDVNIYKTPLAFRQTAKDLLKDIYLGRTTYDDSIETGKNGLEVVKQQDKLFLFGKPGAGKTTFLKYLVFKAIEGNIDGMQYQIPIFIELRRFVENQQSFEDYITYQFSICNFPDAKPYVKAMLEHGKAIVLCDGLDEVTDKDGKRELVMRELEEFAYKYRENRFVVTCRVAATEYHGEAFNYIEMADFSDSQIQRFVNNWFTAYSNRENAIFNRLIGTAEEHTALFFKEFEKEQYARLADLARTPLLLALLCLIFEQRRTFPTQRYEIYEKAVELFLEKWDIQRDIARDVIYKELNQEKKHNLFSRIALESFLEKKYVLEEKELISKLVAYLRTLLPREKSLDGAYVLKTIEAQHGIFVEQAEKFHSFSHLTFHEYFTAYHIVRHAAKKDETVTLTLPALPEDVRQNITAFLASLPRLHDRMARQALIYNSGLDAALQAQLDIEGAPAHFAANLVNTLNMYGKLIGGRHALTVFLESTKQYVGQDRQTDCEQLIQAISHHLQHASSSQSAAAYSLKNIIQTHYADPDWREVFLLLAEMLDDAMPFSRMFFERLDMTISSDPKLERMLELVKQASDEAPDDVTATPFEIRAMLLSTGVDTVFLLNKDLQLIDTPMFSLEQIFGFDKDFSRPQPLSHAKAFARNSLFALDQTLFLASESIRDHDVTAQGLYERAVQLAKKHGETTLHQALKDYSLPSEGASEQTRNASADQLLDVMRSHRPIAHYELTETQLKCLKDYSQATQLLRECLHISTIPDRTAFENRLLRLPE